ncbi:MAG TPA: glycoside hydrolase family 95 protein, partial [Terrimicrobiaceae bacterium]|nr:glycoside hydrolase family 95 protein [Terrimicrobiaceae bacterium]
MNEPPARSADADFHTLWSEAPAEFWEEGFALGNGRLGAVIFGGTASERILLNEETLGAGRPDPSHDPSVRESLASVRQLIREKRYAEADRLAEAKLYGEYTQPYLPLGELLLEMELNGEVTGYRRELDLREACARITFASGGAQYFREIFVSAPDNALILRLGTDRAAGWNGSLRLQSPLEFSVQAGESSLSGEGRVPALRPCWGSAEPPTYDETSKHFATALSVTTEGGRVIAGDGMLRWENCRTVTVVFTAGSSFRGELSREAMAAQARSVCGQDYSALRTRHTEDFSALYGRCALQLEGGPSAVPTAERLKRAAAGQPDPVLDTLLFHLGRYLLISCSRPGTIAANLQGIWNPYMQPPWSCNYTMNINVQMNYWPAEVTALAECHEPLFALVESLRPAGRLIARENYGCRGFCVHHQTDLAYQAHARGVTPTGVHHKDGGRWAMWPMAAAWLCRHYWEHYCYQPDPDFLRDRARPVLREACEFLLDWLQEDGNGHLTTIPSTSPENMFVLPDGTTCSLSAGATMDLQITRDLFQILLKTDAALGMEDSVSREVRAALPRLLPARIGRLGQLQEWSEDWDRPDDKHRHISHMFGVYPGEEIVPGQNPDLVAAAIRSLDLRGDEGTGWSRAWKVALWARLGDGNRAHRLLRQFQNFIQPAKEPFYDNFQGGLYPNLFCACPPLQIEGNFGVT